MGYVSVPGQEPNKCGVVMGGLSPFHWLIIAAIVFLLFGNRLPSVMRSLGQGVVEFKKGLQGIEDDVKSSANTSSKIEEQPSKPQAKSDAEHGSADAAPR
jgi:sec-independent protein translocase protein TatA